MSTLFLEVIKALVAAMMAILSPENVRKIIGTAFDAVENRVIASETKWDDALVLPILKALRRALGVPDNNEPQE